MSTPLQRQFTLLLAVALLAAASGCRQVQQPPASGSQSNSSVSTVSSNSSSIAPLRILPDTGTVAIGGKLDFSATGGVPPFVFSASQGTISSVGSFKAPYLAGPVTITVQDGRGATASASVTVMVGTSLSPNDPLYSSMANLNQANNADINAPEAWAIQTDCRDAIVAVLDTGIDSEHPDLSANVRANPNEIAGNNLDDDGNGYVDDVRGWNFMDGTADTSDGNLHGTHVAGTIGAAGNNAKGVTGICWQAQLVPLKFLDDTGSGYMSDAIDAIDYAAASGVKVINASFGGGSFSQNFKDALDRANAAGVLFVAAAGNSKGDNDASPLYPASYASSNVLSVAAVDSNDALASFSNYGATSVHLAAPGVGILSTFPSTVTPSMTSLSKTSSYERISGTSMAAPHVAGAAALAWSFEPDLSLSQVRSRLLDRADSISSLNGKVAGSRRLNLRKVLYAQ